MKSKAAMFAVLILPALLVGCFEEEPPPSYRDTTEIDAKINDAEAILQETRDAADWRDMQETIWQATWEAERSERIDRMLEEYESDLSSDFNRSSAPASSWQGYTCDRCIKGNTSFDTGEKIYHFPGCEYYQQTVINTDYGERWFSSEAEAQAAGWRKALNCP